MGILYYGEHEECFDPSSTLASRYSEEATDWTTEESEFDSRHRQDTASRRQVPFTKVNAGSFPGSEAARREADHSPQRAMVPPLFSWDSA
jgi:hypothetical protein